MDLNENTPSGFAASTTTDTTTATTLSRTFLRALQRSSNRTGEGYKEEDDDPYQFVAFLLWYLFLVLCCIVPTCCAYRRRRLIERRMAEQQSNMQTFQQANMFFLSGNHQQMQQQQQQNEETTQQERHGLLMEALKPTTLVISEQNLKEVDSSARHPAAWESGKVVSMHDKTPQKQTEEEEDEIVVEATGKENATIDEPELADVEMDSDHNQVMLLPINTNNDTATADEAEKTGSEKATSSAEPPQEGPKQTEAEYREVLGHCAICLCAYEAGDQVTSAENCVQCPHAFHTDCIVGWLSKKDEPQCPVCRQTFCTAVTVSTPPQRLTWDEVSFPFTRSLAETVALARLSMEHHHQMQQQSGGAGSTNNATTTTITIPSSQPQQPSVVEQSSSAPTSGMAAAVTASRIGSSEVPTDGTADSGARDPSGSHATET